MTPERVAVGGAVGVTAALDLARAGVETHLFERGTVGTSGASARAAGLCYDAHAGPADARLATRALERYAVHSPARARTARAMLNPDESLAASVAQSLHVLRGR